MAKLANLPEELSFVYSTHKEQLKLPVTPVLGDPSPPLASKGACKHEGAYAYINTQTS